MKSGRKKILFICPSLDTGGAEKICLDILERIDRSRFAPVLAVFSNTGRFVGMVPKDVPVIDMKKKKRTNVFRLVASLAFRILPRVKPDVIVSILWYSNLISIIARFLSFYKPRILIKECTSIRMSPDHRGQARRLFFRILYAAADTVIAISNGIRAELMEVLHVPVKKIRVINNGADCERIRKLSSEKITPGDVFSKEGTRKIVSCGRFSWEKNFQLLLESFSRLEKSMNTELAIIGDGAQMAQLRLLAKKLGIADRASFPGFRANPWKYMAKADVFVLSSLFEGFGNVIIEAMASGVPVIACDCPFGPAEIIEHGKNGILVPAGDPQALAGALRKLLTDRRFARELANEGLKRAQEFDTSLMVKKYESIF